MSGTGPTEAGQRDRLLWVDRKRSFEIRDSAIGITVVQERKTPISQGGYAFRTEPDGFSAVRNGAIELALLLLKSTTPVGVDGPVAWSETHSFGVVGDGSI